MRKTVQKPKLDTISGDDIKYSGVNSMVPQVDTETYMKLVSTKNRMSQLKIEAYDIQAYLALKEQELQNIKDAFEMKRKEIVAVETEFQMIYNTKIEEPFNLHGKQVSISDSEPHIITVVG